MSPLASFVDDELLVVKFLSSHPDVAALVAGRVSTRLPASTVLPRIRLNRLGGTSPPPYRLDRPRLQIECLGNTDAEAKDLMSTVRAAIASIVRVHPQGVVTSVDEVTGPQWLPDSAGRDGVLPTPRYLFSIVLTTHPNT